MKTHGHNATPIEISCSQTDETIACNEKIQLVKSQEISEVESKDLIETDIDLVEIFKIMYEEKNEDSFDQIMEVNDQIYTPLFSDMYS